MTDVNKPAIREWVVALRSGNYKQGTEHLAQEDEDGRRYCCLGVACDIFAERVRLTLHINQFQKLEYHWDEGGYSSTGSTLPGPLVKFLGVQGRDPILASGRSLIKMNDDDGATFSEIADAIEKEYLTEGSDE